MVRSSTACISSISTSSSNISKCHVCPTLFGDQSQLNCKHWTAASLWEWMFPASPSVSFRVILRYHCGKITSTQQEMVSPHHSRPTTVILSGYGVSLPLVLVRIIGHGTFLLTSKYINFLFVYYRGSMCPDFWHVSFVCHFLLMLSRTKVALDFCNESRPPKT